MSDHDTPEQTTPQCPVCDSRQHRTFTVEDVSGEGTMDGDRSRTVRTLAECRSCGNVYNPRVASRE